MTLLPDGATTVATPRSAVRGPGGSGALGGGSRPARGVGIALGLTAALAALAGCAGVVPPGPGGARFPVASLPPSTAAEPPVTAAVHRPALVVMGDTVQALLPGGAAARVLASGPVFPATVPARAPEADATITVTITVVAGTVAVDASQFLGNDGAHRSVLLRASPARVTLTPGRTATVTLRGTFATGACALAWEPGGAPMAVWDFTSEFD